MSLTSTEKPRDALASLRIPRDDPPSSGSSFHWVRWLLVLCLLAGLAAAGVYAAQRSELFDLADALQQRVEVHVGTVSLETGRASEATVVATGYLESTRQARIGARAPGRIEVLNVEEGTQVKKGEVLAILEHDDLKAALAAAKATHQKSEAEIEEQRVEIARTKRKFERMQKLRGSRALSETDYDESQFQYEAAVAKLSSMEAAVLLAEARIREAEQMNENMFVRAPFDGTVISKDAELGESILPGGLGEGSGRGSVVTIADLEHLEVDCDVKEDFISRVVVGQTAEIRVDAVPDRKYKGQVRKVIPMGDRARATIKVKVAIVDADERLFPEMSATVFFLPEENASSPTATEERILCPTDAIVEEEEKSYVWLLDSDKRVRRVEVTTGVTSGPRTEIKGGLSGGDRVVLRPPAELAEGQRVTVAE